MTLFTRLARLLRPPQPQRIADFDALASLAVGDMVELRGTIEASERLIDPLAGEECVALAYGASPESTTAGIDGGGPAQAGAFRMTCHQAVDFFVVQGSKRLLVRVDRGRDVGALHRELVARYGLALRAEVQRLSSGQEVVVVGTIERLTASGSPLRRDPTLAVIAAQRFGAAPEFSI